MEYEEKCKLSDDEIKFLFMGHGIMNMSELQQRDDAIRKIKVMMGVTIRQLARITGISRSVIDRMKRYGKTVHLSASFFI